MAVIALGLKKRPDGARFDAPHDPADFLRCYRLVEAAPEIREDFQRIAKVCPDFEPVLNEWDALVALLMRDLSSGKSSDLYRRLSELRNEQPKWYKGTFKKSLVCGE